MGIEYRSLILNDGQMLGVKLKLAMLAQLRGEARLGASQGVHIQSHSNAIRGQRCLARNDVICRTAVHEAQSNHRRPRRCVLFTNEKPCVSVQFDWVNVNGEVETEGLQYARSSTKGMADGFG